MSQFSSSSQARLEIDEPEAKGATTPNAPPTRNSTCGSLGLRPPRFPKRLACIEVNTPTFQQGFDEKWVDGGIANHRMRTIWRYLPRRPATLDAWGHIFSERSIKQHFQIRSAPQSQWSSVKAAPCPTCMRTSGRARS